MEPIYDGWFPPVKKYCIRCGNQTSLGCNLCDDCHEKDREDAEIEAELDADLAWLEDEYESPREAAGFGQMGRF